MLTVVCSFSQQTLVEPAIAPLCQGRLLLGNYPEGDVSTLRPWEGRIYLR